MVMNLISGNHERYPVADVDDLAVRSSIHQLSSCWKHSMSGMSSSINVDWSLAWSKAVDEGVVDSCTNTTIDPLYQK